MNRRKQTAEVILCLLACFAGGLLGCSTSPVQNTAAPETVNDVSVIVVHKTKMPDWIEAVGTVRAALTSQVASQLVGNILEIRAGEGESVQSGQVMAIIDDARPRAGVDQATAALNAAEKEVSAAESDFSLSDSTLKRYQQLYEKKSVSPQEFDEINARRRSAEARRDMARAQQAQANAALTQARTALGYTEIRSSFAGVVTEKRADVGTLVSPGTVLFAIEDIRSYRLEVSVDENDIRVAHIGMIVPVVLDALGSDDLRGKVTQIVPVADPASRSVLVKINLPANAGVRSGLFGRARFARGERASFLVKRSSIIEHGQLEAVYVVDANGIANQRYVTLGTSTRDDVEVLTGLQDGETLIAAPDSRDLGGKRIVAHQ